MVRLDDDTKEALKGVTPPLSIRRLPFYALTEEQQRERLARNRTLAEVVKGFSGVPTLSQWDRSFLFSIRMILNNTRGEYELSEAQWEHVERIADTLADAEVAARKPKPGDLENVA